MRTTVAGSSVLEDKGMTAPGKSASKRISPGAYQALREALPVVFFYKRPFESYLRMALRDHPELLAGLNFKKFARSDDIITTHHRAKPQWCRHRAEGHSL
jgi:hypothetical protein